MGYLYYCKKCNAFEMANTDSDPTIRHWDCAQKCVPLYVTDDNWKRMSGPDRSNLINQAIAMEEVGGNRKKTKSPVVPAPSVSKNDAAFNQAFTQQPQGNMQPQDNQPAVQEPSGMQGRVSGMSITGFIMVMTGFLTLIGFILALVDVCKKDGRKKGLSIAALILSSLEIIAVIALIAGVGSILTML